MRANITKPQKTQINTPIILISILVGLSRLIRPMTRRSGVPCGRPGGRDRRDLVVEEASRRRTCCGMLRLHRLPRPLRRGDHAGSVDRQDRQGGSVRRKHSSLKERAGVKPGSTWGSVSGLLFAGHGELSSCPLSPHSCPAPCERGARVKDRAGGPGRHRRRRRCP